MGFNLAQRAAATEKTRLKFIAKPFSWKEGRTCIHMVRRHLLNMGRRPPKIPAFQSEIGARRALRETGFDSLTALLDDMLERITPAAMLVGDIATMRGGGGFEAIVISSGGREVFGYADEDLGSGLVAIIPHEFEAAWRV